MASELKDNPVRPEERWQWTGTRKHRVRGHQEHLGGGVCQEGSLDIHLYTCLSGCLGVLESVYLSIWMLVCLEICLSG